MSHRENITRIRAVYLALEELASEVVFVGGATVSLYSTRPLEAFVDRGENEGRFSSDFEDIIHVLNNRQSIWEEIKNAEEPVKQYLKSEFAKLLNQKYIDEWVSAHLEYNEQRRASYILGSMSEFVED